MDNRTGKKRNPALTETAWRFVVAAKPHARILDICAVIGYRDTNVYAAQQRFGQRLPRGRSQAPLSREALLAAWQMYRQGERPSLTALRQMEEEDGRSSGAKRYRKMWTTGETERLRTLAGYGSIYDIGIALGRSALAVRQQMQRTPHEGGTLYEYHRSNTIVKLAAELRIHPGTISNWHHRHGWIECFNDVRNPRAKEAVLIVRPFDADWLRENYRWAETDFAALARERAEE